MSPEEIQALVAENDRLRAEVSALQQQVAGLTGQLQTALARIAELEQGAAEPPPFVKPNRPPREAQGPARSGG